MAREEGGPGGVETGFGGHFWDVAGVGITEREEKSDFVLFDSVSQLESRGSIALALVLALFLLRRRREYQIGLVSYSRRSKIKIGTKFIN